MTFFEAALFAATLLCALCAGLLFTFAVVVMPGIRALDDRAFLRGFQAMDGVIQRGQPLFGLVWVGSVLALLAATIVGFGRLEGAALALLVGAAGLYVLGVQAPTIAVNLPLNGRVQRLRLDEMSNGALQEARSDFEPRWVRWNAARTGVAILVTALLLSVVWTV